MVLIGAGGYGMVLNVAESPWRSLKDSGGCWKYMKGTDGPLLFLIVHGGH